MKLPVLSLLLVAWPWTAVFADPLSVGPDYQRPAVPDQANFADDLGKWQLGNPADTLPRGLWWTVFNDKTLNQLIVRVAIDNQNLQAAAARVTEARALSRAAKADFFPSLALDPTANRFRSSGENGLPSVQGESFRVPVDMGWELDLWGRVRRSVEAAKNDSLAREAAYYALELAVQTEVAQTYLSLRAKETEQQLFQQSIKLRQENLNMVQSRVKAGISTDLDLSRAETELATAQSDNVGISRDLETLRNALALLVGTTPAGLKLKAAALSLDSAPPILPAGLPSSLLERRPDIAEAERNLMAANARIGVAKAAFFPTIRLTGFGGYESADIDTLFNWQARAWSLGPSISLPIFQGGRNRANLKRSEAAYEAAVATYRQSVLVAFREVQDALTGSRLLATQTDFQKKAVVNARQAASLSRKQFEAGLISYFEVLDAERNALAAESQLARLTGQRFVTSTQLIKALGGGWTKVPAPAPAVETVPAASPDEPKKPWFKRIFRK
jgi:outer membrane protein, multidrug efflux system